MKALKRKLDLAFSKYMRQKYPACQHCRKRDNLQIHHIYSRKNLSVRWDEDNIVVVCPACHFYFHQHPIEFVRFLEKVKGKRKLKELEKKAKMVKKWDKKGLEKMLSVLREI